MSSISAIRAMNNFDGFQHLIDAITDVSIYMLDPEGHVVSWNNGAERLNGYQELEILGRSFACFHTSEDIDSDVPAQSLNAAKKDGGFETEAWRVRKDGSNFRAQITINPVWDGDKIAGFAKITRDISARAKAELELKGARTALHNAQKLDVVSRLTGGVAHEFGNLMTALRGSAEGLASAALSQDDRDIAHKSLVDTIDKASSLAAQLLTFSSALPLRPEPFDIVERTLALRPLLETILGGTINLKLRMTPDLMPVDTDRHQFETALINLITNARDALIGANDAEDRVITLSVAKVVGHPDAHAHIPPGSSFAAISVADGGPGISGAILPLIFDPFYTTKAQNNGVGLGLAQVRNFAKQSGGDIEVVSRPGEGAVFTLYLPCVRQRVITPIVFDHKVDTPVDDDPQLSGSVLLVEDNPRMAETAEALLEDIGLTISVAGNAEQALAILQTKDTRFDLVLTDVVMPGMSGIALARLIGRRWPDLPVLLTSGYSDELTSGHGDEFDLIQKPYSRKALFKALQNRLPFRAVA